MFKFFASVFGSLLNFLYDMIGNYGLAIILFSVVIKIILLPFSIKQQKSMKQANIMQEEMKKIQDKYGNDQEKINQEIIELYRKTGVSPFSGCFISIIQFLLIISVFIMVRSPLTHVKKVNPDIINNYTNQLKEEKGEEVARNYPEISIIKEYGKDNKDIYINMDFFGIDLSDVPTNGKADFMIYLIPLLYVVTSIISVKLTSNVQPVNAEGENPTAQMNKTMMFMVPIMSISIAIIAPLGLTLYWFMSNVLSIIERIIGDKFQKQQEEVL